MTTELSQFLKPFICTGQRDEDGKSVCTHTSLHPKVSYNIPADHYPKLYRLVAESIANHKQVFLTERPYKVKPITIDIDLKYPADYTTRQHSDRHIKKLLKLYGEAITTYVDLPDDYPIDAYIFQRKYPYPGNGNIKDGIHIMYPDICIDSDIQHIIRNEVLKKIDQFIDNPDIGCLPVKNSHEEIIDKGVVSSGNWTMYGGTKPGLSPYKLTAIYRAVNISDEVFEELQTGTTTCDDIEALVSHLSTRNITKDRTFEIREEMSSALDIFLNKTTAKKESTVKHSTNHLKRQTKSANEDEELKCQIEEAKELVVLLADWRAENYNHWIEVGLCLHNISPGLQDTWIEFSKKSEKYNPSVDANRWYEFTEKNSGLNIGSLHRWARLDNPFKYKSVRNRQLRSLMLCSVSGLSQDVAAVIYKMYRYQYVCLDSKGKKWAEYVNHSWRINEGMGLKKIIGEDVLDEYLALCSYYNHEAENHKGEDKNQYLDKWKDLTDVTYKLRDIVFKDKIIKECIIMFHDAKFEQSLNINPYHIGMENGVYDLSAGLFRDGRPEDYVSITTGNDYPDFDESDINLDEETSSIPHVQAIFDFMRQILPLDGVRRYMWLCLASYLEGYNREELFHIWTGVGGNGKSKLLSLFELAFGDYTFKMPITLLTQKRGQSGGATPELTMSIGKRFGSFQEPDEGAKINTGLMKELTGNDKLYQRGLFAEARVIKPMWSPVLLCNAKPKIASDDDGTWRRTVVIEFIGRAVAGQPKAKYEFVRNNHLDQLFPEWAPYFIALLTMYHKIYKIEGLKQCKEIEAATYDYRKQSDAYAMFMDDYFVKEEEGSIKLDDSYAVFKDWYTAEFSEKAPPRREYKSYVERKLNVTYGIGSRAGWNGWTMRHPDASKSLDVSQLIVDDVPEAPKAAVKLRVGCKPLAKSTEEH